MGNEGGREGGDGLYVYGLTWSTLFVNPVFWANCLRSLASGLWFRLKYVFIVRNWKVCGNGGIYMGKWGKCGAEGAIVPFDKGILLDDAWSLYAFVSVSDWMSCRRMDRHWSSCSHRVMDWPHLWVLNFLVGQQSSAGLKRKFLMVNNV